MTDSRLLQLKRFDAIAQLALAFGPPVISAIASCDMTAGAFAGYVLVGGWRLISNIATLATPDPEKRWKSSLRPLYNVVLLIIITGCALCLTDGQMLVKYLYAMLFITPLLALLYVIVSFVELATLKKLRAAAVNQPGSI